MKSETTMKRIDQILSHPVFREQFALLQEAEKDRIFCRHTMEHFLDVARLMYIYTLEDQAGFSKEMLYAAGLLHDIGRYEQMEQGTPHHLAGARLAEIILTDCGFSPAEQEPILAAIRSHRVKDTAETPLFSRYLYRADKQSRNCFSCPARAACNWPEEKMNLTIRY